MYGSPARYSLLAACFGRAGGSQCSADGFTREVFLRLSARTQIHYHCVLCEDNPEELLKLADLNCPSLGVHVEGVACVNFRRTLNQKPSSGL